jgi:putative AlgH/UPF0301 family transcriptional regulator
MGKKCGNANRKDQKEILLSNVGKIQSQMSRTIIYVKETWKHTQKDTMGVSMTKEVSK